MTRNVLMIIYFSIGLGLQVLVQIKNIILGRRWGVKTLVDIDTKLFVACIVLEIMFWPEEVILSTIYSIRHYVLHMKPTKIEKMCDEAYDRFIENN